MTSEEVNAERPTPNEGDCVSRRLETVCKFTTEITESTEAKEFLCVLRVLCV